MTICNIYKSTLDEFINNSDTKSPDRPNSPDRLRLIDKGSYNEPRSRGGSPTLLKEDYLYEEVPIISLEPASKIQSSQVHQHYDVTPFDPKSGRAQYGNGQRYKEVGKGRRSRENGKGKRDE